jgi:hypothetical protein
MDPITTTETHSIVGAGAPEGPVYLSESGAMTARPLLAKQFKTAAEANEVGLHEAKRIPAGKGFDWRVFTLRTTTLVSPV